MRYGDILAEELAVLTGTMPDLAPAAGDRERRARLADLATRLAAVLPGIEAAGLPAPECRRLTELVTDLRACDSPRPPVGEALTELWDRTVELLTELSDAVEITSRPRPGTPSPEEKGAVGRRPFWKRRD